VGRVRWIRRRIGGRRTKEIVKELAAVLVRVKAVVDVKLQARVDMTVVELAVQNQEDLVCISSISGLNNIRAPGRTIVDEWGDRLRLGPLGLCVKLLGEAVPPTLVGGGDLLQIVLEHRLVEVHDELGTPVSSGRLFTTQGARTRLTTSGICANAACWAICCCTASSVASSIIGCGAPGGPPSSTSALGEEGRRAHPDRTGSGRSCRSRGSRRRRACPRRSPPRPPRAASVAAWPP
jgi:hypothetical protein